MEFPILFEDLMLFSWVCRSSPNKNSVIGPWGEQRDAYSLFRLGLTACCRRSDISRVAWPSNANASVFMVKSLPKSGHVDLVVGCSSISADCVKVKLALTSALSTLTILRTFLLAGQPSFIHISGFIFGTASLAQFSCRVYLSSFSFNFPSLKVVEKLLLTILANFWVTALVVFSSSSKSSAIPSSNLSDCSVDFVVSVVLDVCFMLFAK